MSEPVTEDQQRPGGVVEPTASADETGRIDGEPPRDSVVQTEESRGPRVARVVGQVEPTAGVGPAGPSFTRFDCADPEQVAVAAEAARHAVEAGECVVLPTDTVYGIGADAFNAKAVQRLLDAKGRGRDMPPPVLIADASLVRALASSVPEAAEKLTSAFWPGALTIIVSARASARMDLGDTEGTIALRVPDHELARTLLRQTGPMAVSSANRSGQPAALDCDEAVEQLGDSVSIYLDGGRLGDAGRPPSTMVDFSQSDHGRLLRLGAISLAELRAVCPELEDVRPESLTDPAVDSDASAGEGEGEGDGAEHAETVTPAVPEPAPAAPVTRTGVFTLQPPRA